MFSSTFHPEWDKPKFVSVKMQRLGTLTRSVRLQTPAARTPGGSKPPHPRTQDCNKENEAQGKATPVSGALQTPQRNFSMASVASTYSEFVVN